MLDEQVPSLASTENSVKTTRNSTKPEDKKRVTFVIPQALDQLLEIYCSSTGQLKNEVAAAALAEHLSNDHERLEGAMKSTRKAIDRFITPPIARPQRRRSAGV